jgi:hypothetical protein
MGYRRAMLDALLGFFGLRPSRPEGAVSGERLYHGSHVPLAEGQLVPPHRGVGGVIVSEVLDTAKLTPHDFGKHSAYGCATVWVYEVAAHGRVSVLTSQPDAATGRRRLFTGMAPSATVVSLVYSGRPCSSVSRA